MDVFSDGPTAQPSLGPTPEEAFLRYLLSLSFCLPAVPGLCLPLWTLLP